MEHLNSPNLIFLASERVILSPVLRLISHEQILKTWSNLIECMLTRTGYILRFNDFTFIQLQRLDCPTSSPSSNFRNAERSGFLFPFFAAPLVSIPSTFRVIPAALDVVASGESSDSKTTIHPLPKFECETLFRNFLKKKTHKKMKGHFWKDDMHHIYLFHTIEAATPFHPFRVERSGFISLPPDHIQEPWIKATKPWNLEINIQIWKFKPSVADCFRKCMGDKSATLKNQSESQNPPHPRGSQTHRRRHISQPPMRVHQLFGLFRTPASSCGRHRRGGQRCRKKPGFETSNNTQHKSSFMGHLSLASFSWAGHPAASDFSLNFWRKNSRQIRWTLQQHR